VWRWRNIKGGSLANPLAPTEQAPNIVAGALRAHLDWTTVRAGEQTVPITVESSDPDVEALSAKPAELQVTLDRAEGKTLQVQPRIEPALAEGVSLQRVTISPATAAVYGAAQTLTRVSRVQVRLNARSLEVGVEREVQGELVAVDTKGDEVSEVRIFPETVQVRAALREESVTQRVNVQVRLRGSVATGYEAGTTSVQPSRVLVRGRRAALAKLAPIAVVVDVSGARELIQRRVRIDLPRGVSAVGTSFVTVTVPVNPLRPDEALTPPDDGAQPQPQTTPSAGATPDGSTPLAEPALPQTSQGAAPTPRVTPEASSGF
jgi:YbbR domain-containing protein